MTMTNKHAKINEKDQWVQKQEWKQTDERTRPIALSFPQTLSMLDFCSVAM